ASQALKRFLFDNLYRHPQVVATTGSAQVVVRELFQAYLAKPESMKPGFALRAAAAQQLLPRVVADFIAGMTDRFAAAEHERLTGRRLLAK
ncbi:MAG: deoxyguanosinetriphosphate triphosphohydrolase, partial [Giesbergeria sp.]